MLHIDKVKMSLISPYAVIILNEEYELEITKDLIIAVFFQHHKYSLIQFPYAYKVYLDFFKEIDCLRKLDFVVISVIDYSGNEYYKQKITIDHSNSVLDYTKRLSLKHKLLKR
ncbi:hypothetical protein JEG43_04095 [Anoxybacillus sp. LAT_35]|nr:MULTISPECIES: hypothetical protein [unclassified Anoxybacillus]MCG5024426.1 hypothetical protein [Anoxybacillus flavithermus]GAC89827.1 hypothetical protein KN10_0263 [Anoxybacillus flavithermus NBRC 109594]MCG3083507.1 hypothetical protein [Anoxybacillus sp. LAT27]MCG6172055.1 hypothetical protein [Anoxybacillus sp. LAT_11]MCG6174528.1 hypothetical protein [Anoxybacillus sp. LAT_31]